MKTLRWLTVLIILASASVHAFGAWPSIQIKLDAAMIDKSVVAGLHAGWLFGSLWMFAAASILLRHIFRSDQTFALQIASFVYLVFGLGGFVLRDYHPHYLGFVACGILLFFCSSNGVKANP